MAKKGNNTALISKSDNTALQAAASRVIEIDLAQLIDPKAIATIEKRKKKLEAVMETVSSAQRDAARLEAEIQSMVGEKIQELKATRKTLRNLQKLQAGMSEAIYQAKMDALDFIPGESLDEKKRHIIQQRRELAK